MFQEKKKIISAMLKCQMCIFAQQQYPMRIVLFNYSLFGQHRHRLSHACPIDLFIFLPC